MNNDVDFAKAMKAQGHGVSRVLFAFIFIRNFVLLLAVVLVSPMGNTTSYV